MNILVFGDLNLDLFFQLDLEEIELRDVSYIAKALFISPGGGAGNLGVALTRLGLNSMVLSKIGSDVYGSILIKDLMSEGIRVDYISQMENEYTGIMAIILREDGKRTIIGYRGANSHNIIDEDYARELIDKCDYVYISGFTTHNIDNGDSIEILIRQASREKVMIGMDLGGINRDFLEKRLSKYSGLLTDVFLNIDELSIMYDTKDYLSGLARLILTLKPQNVFLKMGNKGALVYHNERFVSVEPYRIDRVIDTTGCGDAFNAGAIYGLFKGYDSVMRARLGNAMGAYKASGISARHLPKNVKELEEFINNINK